MTLPFSSLNNTQIAAKISEETILRAGQYLDVSRDSQLINKLNDYKLVITGTIGAGKSTACESVVHVLKCIIPNNELSILTYPEFLYVNNNKLSIKLLTEKINGNISPNTFQSYVLDNWWHIMKQNENQLGFKLFERCIDDCVTCFCNMENKRHKISDLQLMSLYEDLKQLVNKYDVPTYFMATPPRLNSHFTKIISSDLNYNLQTIFSIISADLHNGIKNRIIGLYVDSETSKDRIIKRSRTGETGYTDDQIAEYTNHYKKLFKMLDKGERIKRFVDLGQLL